MHVVNKGLQHETDRQKESEQHLNPIQQMLIGPGLGMINERNMFVIFVIYIVFSCL